MLNFSDLLEKLKDIPYLGELDILTDTLLTPTPSLI